MAGDEDERLASLDDDNAPMAPLYSFGSNNEGRLGCGSELELESAPRAVAGIEGISIGSVEGGARHTLIADSVRGTLYAMGDNSDGQLGKTRAELRSSAVPVVVSGIEFVLSVAAGRSSSYALDGRRKVYSWGDGRNGRLGHGDTKSYPRPKLVEGLATWRVKQIAAGDNHCLALTLTGQVYAWGHGRFGQLGLGEATDVMAPAQIEALRGCRVVYVAAGRQHSGAVGDTLFGRHLGAAMDKSEPERVVFTWGSGADGRLGHDDPDDCYRPRVVQRLRGKDVKISKLALGERHTLALGAKGVYAWGCLSCFTHKCIEGATASSASPILKHPFEHALCTKPDTRACLRVWRAGNMYGQLGLGDVHARPQPILLENSGTASVPKI